MPTTLNALAEEHLQRMPRSQLLRRSFGHSQHTSPGSKKGSMRITKPSGQSTSPHDIQRRRTTASHVVRASHTPSQTGTGYGQSTVQGSAWSGPTKRPMSWHPSSNMYQDPTAAYHPNDYNLGNTIAELETLAVSGPIQPFLEESANSGNFSAASERSFNPSAAEYNGWGDMTSIPNEPYPSYLEHNLPSHDQYFVQTPYDCVYGQAGFQSSGYFDMEQIPRGYQAPMATGITPFQYPANLAYSESLECPPQVTTKKSKELVGMGLYDDKNGTMVSTADATGIRRQERYTDLHRTSLGKGLKLEETWRPPGEEEAEDVDDYSSDDAEDDLPIAPPQEQQTQVPTDFKDLSNQTFFFEDDDQYHNYIAFDQAMQYCEPKALDPSSGDFLWL